MRLNNELEWSILLLKLLLFLSFNLSFTYTTSPIMVPLLRVLPKLLTNREFGVIESPGMYVRTCAWTSSSDTGNLAPSPFLCQQSFFLCVLSSHSYDRLLFISASSLSVFFLSSVFCWQFLFPSLRGSERGFFLSRSPIRDASSTNCRYICRCWFKVDRLILPG